METPASQCKINFFGGSTGGGTSCICLGIPFRLKWVEHLLTHQLTENPRKAGTFNLFIVPAIYSFVIRSLCVAALSPRAEEIATTDQVNK